MKAVKVSSTAKVRKQMSEFLGTTRYVPPSVKTDKNGMPVVAPDPNDPDDEPDRD